MVNLLFNESCLYLSVLGYFYYFSQLSSQLFPLSVFSPPTPPLLDPPHPPPDCSRLSRRCSFTKQWSTSPCVNTTRWLIKTNRPSIDANAVGKIRKKKSQWRFAPSCSTSIQLWTGLGANYYLSPICLLDFEESPQQAEVEQQLIPQPDRHLAGQNPRRRRRRRSGGEGRNHRRAGRGMQQRQGDPAEEGRGQRHLEQVSMLEFPFDVASFLNFNWMSKCVVFFFFFACIFFSLHYHVRNMNLPLHAHTLTQCVSLPSGSITTSF